MQVEFEFEGTDAHAQTISIFVCQHIIAEWLTEKRTKKHSRELNKVKLIETKMGKRTLREYRSGWPY